MKLALTNYEHELFVGSTRISGVSNTELSYSIPETPINILGFGHIGENFYNSDYPHPYSLSAINGPIEGNVSVGGYLIGEDFFLQYTGVSPTSGSLRYGDDPPKHLGFSRAYLTQHSVKCSINQLPQYTTNFLILGNLGSGLNYEGRESFPPVKVVNQGGIELNFKGSGTNRVVNFSYDVDVNRNAIYEIGSGKAYQVDVVWPIAVRASITLEADDYQLRELNEAFVKPNVEFFEITLKDCDNNYIQRYPMTGARLVDYSSSIDADGVQQANLKYISYINKR